jgi:antitoxin component YwqK of YwqJK toxin-antitoxin module
MYNYLHERRNISQCKFCGKSVGMHLLPKHENGCIQNPINDKYCKECNGKIEHDGIAFCSSVCSATYNNRKMKNVVNFKLCVNCGIQITYINNKKQYCENCLKEKEKLSSVKRVEDRRQILRKVRCRETVPLNIKQYKLNCLICNIEFYHTAKIKTCSKKCRRTLSSKRAKNNVNCGGETNYRKFWYNGIFMDSTWELDIAKWMDLHNVEWQRSRKIVFWWTDMTGTKRRYYPDFYLPKYDIYLDPKNKYLLQKDDYKLNQVIKENRINLIYGHKDLILEKLMGL